MIQIVCGPYPDEPLFTDWWDNEGGKPYLTNDFSEVNPEYFKYADQRIKYICDSGMVPAIVGGWGRADCDAMANVGLDGLKRHWRHLIARYGAYITAWIVGGESYGEKWTELSHYVRSIDPHDRPVTVHPNVGSARESVTDETCLNFDMLQTGHGLIMDGSQAISRLKGNLAVEPPMPVLIGEHSYEEHMQTGPAYVQRYVFWGSMLNEAAGLTYGAAGIWHAGLEGFPATVNIYDWTTWRQGMAYPGSTQLGISKELLEKYPWSQFESHPEWVDADCFAAGIEGEVRIIYMPRRSVYNWTGPTVTNLDPTVNWHVYYFDPATGRKVDQGTISGAVSFYSNAPSPQDWVLVFERVGGNWTPGEEQDPLTGVFNFTEDFNSYSGLQNDTQSGSGLEVAHSGTVSGWSNLGLNTMHAVDLANLGGQSNPSDWAAMIFEDNVATSIAIAANVSGQAYSVEFEASPAVYVISIQATQAADGLLIEVLRSDWSVVASYTCLPGAWAGDMAFNPYSFSYTGDSTGDVRLRVSPSNPNQGRFGGAIDNIILSAHLPLVIFSENFESTGVADGESTIGWANTPFSYDNHTNLLNPDGEWLNPMPAELGEICAVMYEGASVTADLISKFVPNATYRLTFSQFRRDDIDGSEVAAKILAVDGTELASETFAAVTATGTIETRMLAYTTSDSGSELGQGIRLQFVDPVYGTEQCGIDNVVLDAVVSGAYYPDPAHGEAYVELDLSARLERGAVSWQSPKDPNIVQVFGYDVYMDTNEDKVINATAASTDLTFKSLQSDGQTDAGFDPLAGLDNYTTYYWRVDAIVDFDDVPGSTVNDATIVTGRVWSFDTESDCVAPPVFDSNNDCIIDMVDFAAFAATWLECGLSPMSVCP